MVGEFGRGRTAALATDVAPHWVGPLVDWGVPRVAAQAPQANAVEVGDRVRAMGTYPGGQSGNPASAGYRDRLRFWRDGDLELLIAPASLDSLTPSQVSASLTLTAAKARP